MGGVEEFLLLGAADRPEAAALIDPCTRLSYGELERVSRRVAARLKASGALEGDRILIGAKNSVGYCALFLGALLAGSVPCPVHPGWPKERFRRIIASCEPSAVFADETGSAALGDFFTPLIPLNEFVFGKNAAKIPWRRDGLDPGPPLTAIMHTSASSGEPKGVMLGRNAVRWVTEAIEGVLKYESRDVILCGLPFAFDYSLYQLFLALKSGAALAIGPDFASPVEIPCLLERHRVTVFPLVPSLAALLLRSRLLEGADLPALRLVTSTGEVFPPAHVLRLREMLKGAEVLPMYGLTECKRVSITPPGTPAGREDSVGLPLPGTEIRLVNERGMEAGRGETGALHVAGPHLMEGYWRDREETEEKWYTGAGGRRWLDTGDLLSRDEEGFLYFEGRRDALLKIRGERLHPAEVEAVLAGIPGVAEAAVLLANQKEPCAKLCALIHPDAGAKLDEADILRECRKRLPPAWRPDGVVLSAAPLPRNTGGKLDRHAAGALALALL
jgi:acyl-CoA synthetase (AMP-forming)/AMP-acid ligase II